jgi:hypothetical protein
MKLKNCTFAELFELPAEDFSMYQTIGLSLNPDSWGVLDLLEWSYITVKQIQDKMSDAYDYETMIWIIKELTKMDADKIMQKKWHDVFSFFNFVIAQIKKANELEQKLIYEPDADEEKAGIEKYNQFSYFATIDRLAGGDPLKYDGVGNIQFSVIYSKLLLNRVDNEFSKALIRIKSK